LAYLGVVASCEYLRCKLLRHRSQFQLVAHHWLLLLLARHRLESVRTPRQSRRDSALLLFISVINRSSFIDHHHRRREK